MFGKVAEALIKARIGIENLRNEGVQDKQNPDNPIFCTEQGKYLLYYVNEIKTGKEEFNSNVKVNDIVEAYEKCVANNTPRKISINEVKKMIKEIDAKNSYYKKIYNTIQNLKTDNYKINLDTKLTDKDCELLTMLVNLKDGKYLETWKGKSKYDNIPNIQKLAIFVRTMCLTHQTLDFMNFNDSQWDVVVEGIIKKPKSLILPVIEYKIDSSEINGYISSGEKLPEMEKKIDAIKKYINLFKTKEEMVVYRGDITFNMFKNKFKDGKRLSDYLEEKAKLLRDNYDEKLEQDVVALMIGETINQERFLSTAMLKSSITTFAKSILWKITVPAGTTGASIESFNFERLSESEFLMQSNSDLTIVDVTFDKAEGIWIFEAVVEQNKNKIE